LETIDVLNFNKPGRLRLIDGPDEPERPLLQRLIRRNYEELLKAPSWQFFLVPDKRLPQRRARDFPLSKTIASPAEISFPSTMFRECATVANTRMRGTKSFPIVTFFCSQSR